MRILCYSIGGKRTAINVIECDRIPRLFKTLQALFGVTASRQLDADDQNRVKSLHAIVAIGLTTWKSYMAHMLRGRNSRGANHERQESVIGVADHVHDYMNKMEDMYHAESQYEGFAKKGRFQLRPLFHHSSPR